MLALKALISLSGLLLFLIATELTANALGFGF